MRSIVIMRSADLVHWTDFEHIVPLDEGDGYGFLHEACVQLWREGGDRQIRKDVRFAVAGAGGGPIAGCILVSLT